MRERQLRPSKQKRWLVRSVRFFRDLGFYAEHSTLSDASLVSKLASLHRQEWGRGLEPSDELADLLLLRWDATRVWWKDTEADVLPGNQVYVRTLEEWSTISRGAFRPSDISETWVGERGPIEVALTHGGWEHTLHPQFLDDYIDVSIVQRINTLMRHSGYQFEIYRAFDQTAFVVALTPGEKKKLVRKRGWRFMPLARSVQ